MRVMSEVFQRICKAKKSTMLEFDGESDHCHLLIDLHPDNKISQLVASLKSASSRILRKEFPNRSIRHTGNLFFGRVRTILLAVVA